MIKSFLSWGTALLVLCSGLLSSCDDKNEGGGKSCPDRYDRHRRRRIQRAEIHAHAQGCGQMQLHLRQGLRNRPHGRANPRQRKIRNRIGRHRGRQPRTQYGLPPLRRRPERQYQRQGLLHRTHHVGTRRTSRGRPDTGPVHHNDPYVQRHPDRPRNRSLCLPRKDRGADPSHGRGDPARRQSHRTDGRHPCRKPEALHHVCFFL